VVQAVRAAESKTGSKTRVLVNGPAQLALDVGADGVHLHANAGPAAVRAAQQVYARANLEPVISAACHTPEEIKQATGASMLLFSPIFEKVTEQGNTRGQGLAVLRAAVDLANPTPVLALGGITEKNAAACIQNGAIGVAAIRLFLSEAWRSLLELAPASVRPSS
jgi:thiamine-phosphate pyrophosphorylase